MKDVLVALDDLDYARKTVQKATGLTALQKCRVFDAIDGAKTIIKEGFTVHPLLSVNGFICGKCGHLLSKDGEKLPAHCDTCRALVGDIV